MSSDPGQPADTRDRRQGIGNMLAGRANTALSNLDTPATASGRISMYSR